MRKLSFLAVIWLVQTAGPVFSYGPLTTELNDKADLESEFDRIAEELLSSLSIAHSQTPSRQKRDLTSDLKIPLTDDTGVYRLKTIAPVSQLCYPALYSQFLEIANVTYAICASTATLYTPAEVVVGVYEEHKWIPQTQWYVSNPNGLVAFHYNGYLYVLVADSEQDGTDLVRINIASGEKVVDHTVHSRYATSISIWEMKVDGRYHMAIGNSAGHRDGNDLLTDVFVYEWMGTYFDRYAVLQAYDVKNIQPFHIHGAAYLAIANFRRGKSNYKVDSEIFKYDLDKKSWLSHQKIRTYGATAWEFFTLGSGISQEFFLTIANTENNDVGVSDVKSMIYKFVKDIFVPFQCLPTSSATSIASWSTKTTFLLAIASFDAVHLYQYDGWKFALSATQYTQGSMSYGVNHLKFHSIHQDVILSVSNPRQPQDLSIYQIGFQYENSLQAWNVKSTEWCLNTLQRIESTNTDSAIRLLDDVIFVDQPSPITINGNLIFENGFGTAKLKTPMLKEIITQEVYDDTMLLNLEGLQKRLKAVGEKLNEFEEVLQNSLKIEGDQTVYGHLEFQDVSLNCENKSCRFDSINTTILNGEDISDWRNNLVFLDSEQIVDGTIFAENIEANNITVLGMIDGIDSSNLVTKSGDHNITGQKSFASSITVDNLDVHGLVDGVKISPTDVLLTTGHQNVGGSITFDSIDVLWLEVNGLVNGLNLTKFYEDVVRSDQPATITGTKTFHRVVVDDLIMMPGSKINGIDVVDLWNNALWTEGEQEIKAPMTFESVTLSKNLHVTSGINGLEIPGHRVVDINNFATVTAPHIFNSSTKVNRLNIMRSLNGLGAYEVPGKLPQLDIMLKSGDQVVTGQKTFHTIHLDADSFVKGTVDGVDLSEFKSTVLRRDASTVSNRTWTFNNLVIKGPLNVNKISGHDLDSIYDRALKLSDKEIPDMTFKKIVNVEDLESRNINGIDVERDLVLINKPQVLTGKKTFREIILEENSIVLGLVNNVNVSFLNETLLRIGNQALKSKVFNGNVKINKLTVSGSINNVPITEFVTLDGNEALLHSRDLINVTFNEIEATNLEVAGTVNTINVENMIRDTMTYEGYEQVTGNKTVKGTIHIAEGDDFTAGTINGVSIDKLWNDAVLKDESQVIEGVKTFKNSVTFDDFIFKDTIDGVSEWDISNWMLKDSPQTVEGDVIFSSGLSARNLHVKGYINGINLTELDSTIVKINEPNVVKGPIIFENILVSNGNITLSGKIQGIDLYEEVITKHGDKVITGVKTFTQDLVVDGDASVDGLVDGVSIEDLCQKTLLVGKEQNVTHLTIKGDVTFLGGGNVGGNVSGIDLNELRKIAVTTEDSDLDFTGHKTFKSLKIEGPVKIEGNLGGVDLNYLNQTYMSLTRDQEIPARMDFSDVKFEGTLSAQNFNTGNKMVNGVDIGRLYDRVLRKDGTQTVTAEHHFDEIVFDDDVFVAGKVNGLDVPAGIMRHNRTNYIQSPKIFEKSINVLGDIIMDHGKQIQGVDVSEWSKKAVLKDGGVYEIDGYKSFNDLYLTDARVEGLLDGAKISEDALLMTYGNQVVTGQKTIIGDVEVRGSLTVNGFINGQNLEYLDKNTLQRGRTNIITGLKSFSQPLTVHNLEAPIVAGVDVVELKRKIDTRLDFSPLQSRLDEMGGVIRSMQKTFNQQAVVFQYYELYQTLDFLSAYNLLYVSGNDCGELLLISDNSSSIASCSSVWLYSYDQVTQEFTRHPQELLASFAVSVKSMSILDTTYLFVANQNPNPLCLNGRSSIGTGNATGDIYIWNGGVFELYQTLEIPPVMHMEVFKDESVSCIVYMEIQHCTVYCSKGRGQEFELWETLPTIGGRKSALLDTQEEIILAIIAEDLTPREEYFEYKKPVDVYFWDFELKTFGQPMKPIQSTYAQSVLLMNYATEYSTNIFLVVAEGRIPRVNNEPKLSIYRYEESSKQFVRYQEIVDYGELEWIVLETGELILFVLDTHMGKVKLYQYKGVSGFDNIDTLNSIGSVSIHAFIRRADQEDSINHYLALAGPRALMAQPSQGTDYVKVLKSKVKGRRQFLNH